MSHGINSWLLRDFWLQMLPIIWKVNFGGLLRFLSVQTQVQNKFLLSPLWMFKGFICFFKFYFLSSRHNLFKLWHQQYCSHSNVFISIVFFKFSLLTMQCMFKKHHGDSKLSPSCLICEINWNKNLNIHFHKNTSRNFFTNIYLQFQHSHPQRMKNIDGGKLTFIGHCCQMWWTSNVDE
jgi:hypothetical protein